MLEVELRSFVTEARFQELIRFFNANGKFVKEENQETHYFDTPVDLRIQKGQHSAKLWLKKGKMHDEQREEIELHFSPSEFDKAKELINALGYDTKIKWLRRRQVFDWEGITVCLDHTKQYGFIIELEKMCSKGEEELALEELKGKMRKLKVEITPKEEFESRFREYERNWRKLLSP
ncbi:MAG: CYTH domain-containing protein [Candidatus Altiarchaeota archaeon]|nr:CYTH domain-containing protein [Candidatus Altiarchaeota archaeon]